MTFKWNVSPSGFSIVNDTTLSEKPFTFPINAKLGVVYSAYYNSDTTTVTLTDTNVVVPTPAGNINCVRFRYTEPVYSGLIKIKRTGYLWLNTRYGVIRQEFLNPVDTSSVKLQELSVKNF
jgi:hypothetical protein